jgi:hypothetical protein
MSNSQPPPSDPSFPASNEVQLKIVHEESNAKFSIKCNPELVSERNCLSERNGLKRLLRSVVPKLNEGSTVCGNVSSAVLSYRDEDGDLITVRTDSDLKEAIRLARQRPICLKITFDPSELPVANLDASAAVNASSWSDSSSDVQIEYENAAPDCAHELPLSAVAQCSHDVPVDAAAVEQRSNDVPVDAAAVEQHSNDVPVDAAAVEQHSNAVCSAVAAVEQHSNAVCSAVAAVEQHSNAVSTAQPVPVYSLPVDERPRVALIEQAFQLFVAFCCILHACFLIVCIRQTLQIWEAVEDINRTHAQDRILMNQSNKHYMSAIEEVHSYTLAVFCFRLLNPPPPPPPHLLSCGSIS